ncbi:nucleotidyltransferase family protein [Hydrogenophaga sp. R2]|uniref:nucleotidyltransferase family protein n=1 Tax=Hydrogenophaga sp. R2 TaxID=3132827 RepID=UPI003CE69A7C
MSPSFPSSPLSIPSAMVLAAGRGMRMRPLTDHTPKPLLQVHGRPLMQWPMDTLASGGVGHFVVNTAWLGDQIAMHCRQWQARHPGAMVQISDEGADFGYALETAGGISRALPLLGEVFWVLAADVYAPGFTFDPQDVNRFAASDALAHLWLVPNPPHNPRGDFGLDTQGRALNGNSPDGTRLTYSTIGLYRRALFEPPWCDIHPGNPQGTAAPLAPLLRRAMDAGRVTASRFDGAWTDVGTPERLAELNATD